MGPTITLAFPLILFTLVSCAIIVVISEFVNRYWMYHAPEDVEEWKDGEAHFRMDDGDEN